MTRRIVPIKQSPGYTGNKSVAAVYKLIEDDPAFASLWFKIKGRTVCFEDDLTAYAEQRKRIAPAFPPAPPANSRRRGRPPLAVTESVER